MQDLPNVGPRLPDARPSGSPRLDYVPPTRKPSAGRIGQSTKRRTKGPPLGPRTRRSMDAVRRTRRLGWRRTPGGMVTIVCDFSPADCDAIVAIMAAENRSQSAVFRAVVSLGLWTYAHLADIVGSPTVTPSPTPLAWVLLPGVRDELVRRIEESD